MVILSFADNATADIAYETKTKAARKTLPQNLYRTAFEKPVPLDAAAQLADLMVWPSLRLEKLKGERRGQHSIRINDRYRICFAWVLPHVFGVEIVDYHRGDKHV